MIDAVDALIIEQFRQLLLAVLLTAVPRYQVLTPATVNRVTDLNRTLRRRLVEIAICLEQLADEPFDMAVAEVRIMMDLVMEEVIVRTHPKSGNQRRPHPHHFNISKE